MKKIRILFFLVIFNTSVFGQQFLWSTSSTEKSTLKYVPLENVIDEVLNFYKHYKYYNDGAGYSKNNFLKAIEKYGDNSENWKNFKQNILKIDNLTVFAIRGNNGEGSIVLVICITKENVNFVSFSNNIENGSQFADGIEKEEFKNWFKTLMN